jgi:hypothetical protein
MKSYSKHFGFFRNKAVTVEIMSLDPAKDHCRIVCLMTGYEFPWDVVRALEIALMRTFCSPRKYPSFVTTEYNRTYPKGYKIEQLGPVNFINKLQRQ